MGIKQGNKKTKGLGGTEQVGIKRVIILKELLKTLAFSRAIFLWEKHNKKS